MSEVKYPKTNQEYIDEIMDFFDFEKVHRAMKALDWTWAGSDDTPDIWEIRQSARAIIIDTIRELDNYNFESGVKSITQSTGGFSCNVSEWDDGCKTVQLSFVVFSWDSSNYDR